MRSFAVRRGAVVLFATAAAMAVALVALTVTAQLRSSSNRFVLTQKLFDVDGPSARDPSRAAWDKGGKGTSAWMEQKQPLNVLSQKAHTRGRKDRFFDAMIRHAPREVSQVLGIPMAKVQKLQHKVAKKMAREFKTEKTAREMHAVHRGMLKGFGSIMLADVNVTDMSNCTGVYKGCDALAENILEVAKSISENCAILYFNAKEYYKCESEIAEPVCKQVDRDFPQMCGPDGFGYAGTTGYAVEHGYFGSESPANIHGAFCNGCAQIERAGGCFASSSLVEVAGRGHVSLAEVEVGDVVRSVSGLSHDEEWTRVLFVHTHADKAGTLGVSFEGGAVSLTGTHPLRLASGELRKAGDIKVGDLIMAMPAGAKTAVAVAVTAVLARTDEVKYVLTENDFILVDGVMGPTQSTMAGWLELLPFKALDRMHVLALASVRAALYDILESPLLSSLEALLDAALSLPKHTLRAPMHAEPFVSVSAHSGF